MSWSRSASRVLPKGIRRLPPTGPEAPEKRLSQRSVFAGHDIHLISEASGKTGNKQGSWIPRDNDSTLFPLFCYRKDGMGWNIMLFFLCGLSTYLYYGSRDAVSPFMMPPQRSICSWAFLVGRSVCPVSCLLSPVLVPGWLAPVRVIRRSTFYLRGRVIAVMD